MNIDSEPTKSQPTRVRGAGRTRVLIVEDEAVVARDLERSLSDMGYDITGPQVHADGEIWSATNFSIRQALIAKYDRNYPADDAELQESCANGETAPQRCPGNRRWIQLVFDSYLLMPTNPSMLQAV